MFLLFILEPFDDVVVVVLLLTIASLSMAFSNVVIDAVFVVQARRDPILGSQDLLSIAWFVQSLGGVIGAIVSGFLMEDVHPKWGFLIYGIIGALLGISCLFLSKDAEKEINEGEQDYVSYWSSHYTEG